MMVSSLVTLLVWCTQRDEYNAIYRMKNGPVVFYYIEYSNLSNSQNKYVQYVPIPRI